MSFQINLGQRFMSDRLQEDLEKIEDLERQVWQAWSSVIPVWSFDSLTSINSVFN